MPSYRFATRAAPALALVLIACSPGGSAFAAQGPRSAGATDPGRVQQSEEYAVSVQRAWDLRSPDARDAAAPRQDLRAPDTRDVAEHSGVRRRGASQPVRLITVAPDGFDWGDAAIGAGGALGAVLLAAGAGTALARRRPQRRPIANA